ncbi:hypothetical protein YYC_04283 [Plasmodium yoelii 17X]|uniref:YIR protein n=1 Tax=Plasmodium yoelii 17X TaxID=1323249 RepID=V7PG82_PLAYE|nr:hypothetical protein YYC_04283 [Plasmodium yoelii 17X]
MDNQICLRFDKLRNYLPDDLNISKGSDIHSLGNIKKYCSNGESEGTGCKTDLDKINGGCLWLFEQNIINRISDFGDSSDEKHKVFIIYIMLWLNFKLNQTTHAKNTEFKDFYNKYIENNTYYTNCKKIKNNDDCSSSLKEATGYNNFKEFIEPNKCLMNIGINDVSNLYDAFKSLCNMYTELSANNPQNKKYLENAREFVEKYEKLNVSAISEDSPYYKVLSTLSNDYNNFKNYCKNNKNDCSDIPLLPNIKTKENGVRNSEPSPEHISEVTPSSSSITNKLIPVLSIIVAIPIFLGIFYKYSLFGFRKRTKKQHLKEKIKK